MTEKTANQFHADIVALGAMQPTHEPRATEFVQPRDDGKVDMVTLIERLIERGHAYQAVSYTHLDVYKRQTQEPRDVADLMKPVDDGFFEAIPVSDKVGKVANMGPDIIEPVEEAVEAAPQKKKGADAPPPSDQLSLF